jgi:hypothetical protein
MSVPLSSNGAQSVRTSYLHARAPNLLVPAQRKNACKSYQQCFICSTSTMYSCSRSYGRYTKVLVPGTIVALGSSTVALLARGMHMYSMHSYRVHSSTIVPVHGTPTCTCRRHLFVEGQLKCVN